VQKLAYLLHKDDYEVVDVSVHPPFTDLRSVQTVLEADDIPIALGAQHCHWEEKGAFTGEVSPAFLAKLNVSYVIVRPLRAPRAVRRDRRDGQQEGQGHPQARHDPDPLLRRDARGARGRRPPMRRWPARCGPGWPGSPPSRWRPGDRLRAHLGHRHRQDRHRRGRPGGVQGGADTVAEVAGPTPPQRCASSTAVR
jgi:hypothetical protein